MGNIISTHIALFPKLDDSLEHLSSSQITNLLLSRYFGNTYAGSPFYFSIGANWMYDISFCEKWGPGGIFELMKENHHLYDRVFVRFIDEMGDYDRIFELPNESDKYGDSAKDCLYLFDKIQFKEFDEMPGYLNELIRKKSGYAEIEVSGSFNARNEIPLDMPNGINSHVTETPDRVSTFPSADINSKDIDIINSILNGSEDISFIYQNYTVERRVSPGLITLEQTNNVKANSFLAKRDNGKLIFNSCGWLNCGDADYLNYIIKRKPEYQDYLNKQKAKYNTQ